MRRDVKLGRRMPAIGMLAVFLGSCALASAQTWRTTDGGNLWSDAANWGGALPANNGTADLIFSLPTNSTQPHGATVMDGNWSIHTITWNADALDGGAASIQNPGAGTTTLTLQSGLSNTSGGKVELYPDVVLPTLQTWSDSGSFNNSIVVFGAVSGPGGIQKTGPGSLSLLSANAYSGGTVLEGGSLTLGTDAALGTGSLLLKGGGIIPTGGARTIANPITFSGPPVTGLATSASFGGPFTEKLTFTGPVDLGGQPRVLGSGLYAGVNTFTNAISNGAVILQGGRWALKGENTCTLTVGVNTVVEVGSDSALGAAGTTVTLQDGYLSAANDFSSSRPFTISPTGTIWTNGHTVVLSGAISAKSLSDNSTLYKDTQGKLVLSGGAKSFTKLDIMAGTVVFDNAGSPSLILGVVRSGATMAGSGPIGYTTVASGGHVSPGDNSASTLTMGSLLSLSAGAILDFDLGSAGADAILFTHGYPSMSGGAVIVNITDIGGMAPNQTYTLMDWSLNGTAAGAAGAAEFQLGVSPLPGSFTVVDNKLLFTTAVPEPSFAALTTLGAATLLGRRRPKIRRSDRLD